MDTLVNSENAEVRFSTVLRDFDIDVKKFPFFEEFFNMIQTLNIELHESNSPLHKFLNMRVALHSPCSYQKTNESLYRFAITSNVLKDHLEFQFSLTTLQDVYEFKYRLQLLFFILIDSALETKQEYYQALSVASPRVVLDTEQLTEIFARSTIVKFSKFTYLKDIEATKFTLINTKFLFDTSDNAKTAEEQKEIKDFNIYMHKKFGEKAWKEIFDACLVDGKWYISLKSSKIPIRFEDSIPIPCDQSDTTMFEDFESVHSAAKAGFKSLKESYSLYQTFLRREQNIKDFSF